ncbi:5-methyltetrahydrofolate--homocysteine methyltransferase [Helicobacter pylori]|uniref:HNH endonuclease n=1 Tax=Helicobacter pylori TaxID=210 RepID=UPI000D378CC3|nr:HNH endonuclease [Helicobacter pylori]PUD37545.1 5-methyltetrahydrofolate--homocysteine methyltransferase [Helicobacter pylori]
MAEWKTDTEEVRQIVKACRDFKRSLQKERCAQFIKNLDTYAREILLERRKIEMQLEKAIGELKKARKERRGFWGFLAELGRDFGNAVGSVIPPVKLCAELCEKGLNLMEDNIEKWEHNVRLLERMLEIYSIQTKASVELVEGAWKSVKKSLNFYTDKHQEFIKRLNQASEAIDNQYNIAPPEILKERDFESPTIVYSPKKSVYDELLKDLREDFSFSLYADLKNRINASSKLDRATNSREREFEKNLEDLMPSSLGVHSYDESLNLAKKHCVKNCKKALQDFAEKIKESPNDLNAMNEAFNRLKTELERVSDDERLKGLRENLASLYADLKDKIHHNALSNDELDRIIAFREKEFEKNLEDLMPSSLGAHSYDESFSLAKKHCVKNCKKALQDFAEKIKESPNDLNAMNEAFDNLETELEHATESLSQKIAPILEQYENYKRQALGYGEFLEKEKEGFIVDEQNPYPDEVKFNALRLAEFDSIFSAIAPLEDFNKTACAHHALKALQAALKDNDLGFDATDLEQIAKGFIPRGYLWHFNANVLGNVALVREELLLGVKHTKGYSLWTEFLQKQN